MTIKNPITRISIFNGLCKGLLHATIFFIGVHLNKIGFSGTQIGILFMTYSLTGLLTILPSGFSNDTFKSKHLLAIALILLSIQYFGLFYVKNFPTLWLIFFMGSIGKTLYSNSIDSLFLKSTNQEHTKKKINIFLSLNYGLIGASIMTAGYLLNIDYSFEKIFLGISMAFLTMAIISQIILPKSETSKFEIIHYKKDILRPNVLFFLFMMFMFSLHYGAEETSYGLFLKNTLGLNSWQSGLYMGIAIFSMSITVIITRKLLYRVKVIWALLIGTFLSGSGLILMAIFTNPIISAVFRIIHETGDASMFFFLYYGIAKLFDLKRIGGNAGIVSFVIIIGASLSNLIFGFVGEKYGYNMPFIIGGVTTILAFILAINFRHLVKHHQA